MMRRKKILASLAAGALAFSGLAATAVMTAAPAEAGGYGCAGSVIASRTITNSSNGLVGYLYLYYDRGSGKNCAVTVHSKSTWNTRMYTTVSIATSDRKYPIVNHYASDAGQFLQYAGPAKVRGANLCVTATGTIDYKGKRYSATIPWGFCGS